jgi:predicted GIY-YIG superfamily endonuclease
MPKKIRISTRTKHPAITVTSEAIKRNRLVYIALANKAQKYGYKKSNIVYIGTTKKGINRIAGSAASKGKKLLKERGFKNLKFYIIYATRGRKRLENTWEKLERALIQAFKEKYYDVPLFNTQGQKADWEKYYKYFSRDRTRRIIEQFSSLRNDL